MPVSKRTALERAPTAPEAASYTGTVPPGPWIQTLYRARDQMVILITGDGATEHGMFQVPLADFLTRTSITAREVEQAIPNGVVKDPTLVTLAPFHEIATGALPASLAGKTVLDVGGYDGLFAGLCLERGAERVRLIDNGEWQNYHWRAPTLPEGVTRIGCDVLEWQEAADYLVFGNVLYHMRDPWRALRHLRTLCRGEMLMWTSVFESETPDFRVVDPTEAAAEHTILDGYFTVFWRPSVPGLLLLLKLTGWTEVRVVGQDGDHVVVTAKGGPL